MSAISKKRNGFKRHIIEKIAESKEVSPRTVDRVINGDSDNDEIFGLYMTITEGINEVFENNLLNAVKKAVPFE